MCNRHTQRNPNSLYRRSKWRIEGAEAADKSEALLPPSGRRGNHHWHSYTGALAALWNIICGSGGMMDGWMDGLALFSWSCRCESYGWVFVQRVRAQAVAFWCALMHFSPGEMIYSDLALHFIALNHICWRSFHPRLYVPTTFLHKVKGVKSFYC